MPESARFRQEEHKDGAQPMTWRDDVPSAVERLLGDGVKLIDITITGAAAAGVLLDAQAILCSTASRCATAAPTVST